MHHVVFWCITVYSNQNRRSRNTTGRSNTRAIFLSGKKGISSFSVQNKTFDIETLAWFSATEIHISPLLFGCESSKTVLSPVSVELSIAFSSKVLQLCFVLHAVCSQCSGIMLFILLPVAYHISGYLCFSSNFGLLDYLNLSGFFISLDLFQICVFN